MSSNFQRTPHLRSIIIHALRIQKWQDCIKNHNNTNSSLPKSVDEFHQTTIVKKRKLDENEVVFLSDDTQKSNCLNKVLSSGEKLLADGHDQKYLHVAWSKQYSINELLSLRDIFANVQNNELADKSDQLDKIQSNPI